MERGGVETIEQRLRAGPRVDPTAHVAPNATIIGEVSLGAEASVWYGALLRGDINRIEIGPLSNLQDHWGPRARDRAHECAVRFSRARFTGKNRPATEPRRTSRHRALGEEIRGDGEAISRSGRGAVTTSRSFLVADE